jgi:hypothetical protein
MRHSCEVSMPLSLAFLFPFSPTDGADALRSIRIYPRTPLAPGLLRRCAWRHGPEGPRERVRYPPSASLAGLLTFSRRYVVRTLRALLCSWARSESPSCLDLARIQCSLTYTIVRTDTSCPKRCCRCVCPLLSHFPWGLGAAPRVVCAQIGADGSYLTILFLRPWPDAD